ncbi:hypothetical protein HY639_00250 [Candidatus Woesearchaeota archaeon]|nr:hypothetical protein [Candidatus Woesearchaeota archaeon]
MLLIGVAHIDRQELQAVKSLMPEQGTVGLELPEDYKQKAYLGITTFFSELASYLECRDQPIVTLDNALLLDRGYALGGARNVLAGKLTPQFIDYKIRDLEHLATGYGAPEVVASASFQLYRFRAIRDVLLSGRNLEQINREWEDINAQRDAYMLKRIRALRPPVIIMGHAHAAKLEALLPEYVRTKPF